MDFSIASILMLDGATNGAVYALLGLATVLVFTVTRVIFFPQGEFVAYGALTMAMLQAGKVPGTVWLLMMLAVLAALMECWSRWHHDRNLMHGIKSGVIMAIPPLLIAWLTLWAAPQNFPMPVQALLSIAVVATFGPLVYRIAYQSLESATPLVLLIVSVGVHFAMTGLGLLFFGAEGFRNPSFLTENWSVGPLSITGQVVIIFTTALLLIAALWVFFERTLFGKALRATAVNRTGARLMGISTHAAGQFTFLLAAGIGAIVMGGAIQCLFGIKGRRWETHSVIGKFWNDAWVWPAEGETPVGAVTIEGACYWRSI